MDLTRAVMIVYNGQEASENEKEEALNMVLEGFKQQDQIFKVWCDINKEIRKEYRHPINDATKGYNLALEKSINIVNGCFNEVMNNEN